MDPYHPILPQESAEAMQISESVLDRALTIGGIGRSETGELSPVTNGIYAGQYAKACEWKRDVLRSSSRTFTPEQVAQYAAWLLQKGYSRSTASLAVRSIRWGHRVAGEPVPDRLPASYVLRDRDSSNDLEGVNDDEDLPARRDPSELLTAWSSGCKLEQPKGARDMLMVCLIYYGGYPEKDLVALDVEDITSTQVEGSTVYELPSPNGTCTLAHFPGPRHDGTICPACAMDRALQQLEAQGVRTGPLLRSCDRGGNYGGTFQPKGGLTTPSGRLASKSLSARLLTKLALDAGVQHLRPSPVRALRIAGAITAYVEGKLTPEQAAKHAGYSPNSLGLLTHLLQLTAPIRKETSL